MPELVNVPDVDGVPAVLFAPGSGGDILLAAADAAGIPFPIAGSAQWGFFLNGQQVVASDNVVAFDFKRDFVISDYPQERGSFESYNKVQLPIDVRFVFTRGGSENDRTDLLASIEAIIGDLNLYDAATPEKTYPNLNLTHYDVRRTTQNGNKLLIVSVGAQEVRQITSGSGSMSDPSATGNVGDTATSSGADQTNTGTVQATDATAAQVASVQAQDFTGGYNVSGYTIQTDQDTGDLSVADPVTGQYVPVPGSASTSTISGLSPAGPDSFTSLNVGTGGLS